MNNKGLTLVEIVVAVTIFSLIVAAVADILIQLYPNATITSEQLSSQKEARKVVDEFVNEIRGATYSSIGSYPITEASTTEIIFYSNPNAASLRDRIRYFLTTTTLMKGVIEPSGNPLTYNSSNEVITQVIHGIVPTTTIFTYYDENYTGSESPLPQPVEPGQVKVVGIKFRIDSNPYNTPAAFVTESKALIRNLKNN